MSTRIDGFKEDYNRWKNRNKLTHAKIAELVGCSRPAITAFELGKSPLPAGATVLELVAQIYPGYQNATTPTARHRCDGCGENVPGPEQGAAFCLACGHQHGKRCGCGAVSAVGARFCGECGEKFS